VSADVNESDDRLVAHRYQLLEELGSGAHGTVWRAVDKLLEVPVAVKQLRLDPAADDATRRRALSMIEREARIVAKLRDHPHVVTVLDVVSDGGLLWIVMELVESRSLAELVRTTGPLPPERVTTIGQALLAALVAAHNLGITHRDVKPANVLIGAGGRVVLADFGVASHDGHSTIAHGPVGTVAYMAPEQFNGVHGNPAGDLFSLGVTLYFALTGTSPFNRSTDVQTMYAVLHHTPPRPAGPDRLADTLLGLMAKSPDSRLTADEAAVALAAVPLGPVSAVDPATPADESTPQAMPAHDAAPDGDDGAASHETGSRTPAEPPDAGLEASTRLSSPTLTASAVRQSALDRVAGALLLAVALALTLAPWLTLAWVDLPWWAYSVATISTVFFGAWAAAFCVALIRPPAPVRTER
jgi:serine/threonine protein kinase